MARKRRNFPIAVKDETGLIPSNEDEDIDGYDTGLTLMTTCESCPENIHPGNHSKEIVSALSGRRFLRFLYSRMISLLAPLAIGL